MGKIMTGMLANFFRWNNSKLIVTHNLIGEKILKICFYVSVKVYKCAKPKLIVESQFVTINNFDSDIRLNLDRSRAMGAALYWTGFHEFREFLFLHRYLKPEMVFVDVGANMGEYSLFAAKRLTRGKVISFEPLPSIRAIFEENVKINGFQESIEIYPWGLSSQEEILNIHEFEDVHEGLATIYPGVRKIKFTVQVQLKRLDDVVSVSHLKRIDFVKIDIEGGELKALKGCRKVIELYRPVFMIEINQETYKTAGYTVDDVLEFFLSLKYQPFDITKRGGIEKCHILPAFGNIVFMPQ